MESKTLLITGAAGYVGAMLCDQFARREDVSHIIAIDKEAASDLIEKMPAEFRKKITYIPQNLADEGWQEIARTHMPSVIIHTAWQIREIYGDRKTSWKWNIDASDRVFEYAFNKAHAVSKLIHFSTVSSYGAFPDNRIDHFYKESESFRKSEYLYAEEKRITEEHLEAKYRDAVASGFNGQVFIVRPAAITGPRGRYDRIRFGLQSALSGNLKGGFVYKLVTLLTSFVPVTKGWLRQYIHEDDVTNIVALFTFTSLVGKYEVFNISPPGDVVLGNDMAKAVGKKTIPIAPWMARVAFFFFWHFTRGKVPTSPGSWRGYSYPIAVDGSKLTKQYGYTYTFSSKEAFVKNEGRYKVSL